LSFFKFEPFRYGNYCGQGPEENLFHAISPIDEIDELCRVHDLEYQHCYDELMAMTGFEIPTLLHQLVAVRGLFPLSVIQSISHYAPEYFHCTHLADQKLVSASKNLLSQELDLRGNCSIGTESSCLISSKTLFMYMIDIFESGLQLDEASWNHRKGDEWPGTGSSRLEKR
jgi:hypothetical protein